MITGDTWRCGRGYAEYWHVDCYQRCEHCCERLRACKTLEASATLATSSYIWCLLKHQMRQKIMARYRGASGMCNKLHRKRNTASSAQCQDSLLHSRVSKLMTARGIIAFVLMADNNNKLYNTFEIYYAWVQKQERPEEEGRQTQRTQGSFSL